MLALPNPPTLEAEDALHREGYRRIAGVDEVGRGSWAGPIVAAAVILPEDARQLELLRDVRDSKQLAVADRLRLAKLILGMAAVGVGWATHQSIDRDGIAAANRRALMRSVAALKPPPDALLLDYFRLPELDLPQTAVPHGDSLSLSIAAASIVAKVFRDRWMVHCDSRFPGYDFARHKGYGTARHREQLAALGPCRLHRQSFAPIAASRS